MKHKLNTLIPSIFELQIPPEKREVEIVDLQTDSRFVQKGTMFFAIDGVKHDGFNFLNDAIKNGANAAVCHINRYHDLKDNPPEIPILYVPKVRQFYAEICAKFYSKQPETIVAVTGTNGKTSVADFCRQLWYLNKFKAASIGTLGVITDTLLYEATHTTPDSKFLHKTLDELVDKGIECLAMEASSHGLEQNRLDAVNVKVAGFTNFTRDHMDYHPTEEDYIKAKARLFTDVLTRYDSWSIINIDDAKGFQLANALKDGDMQVLSFGTHNDANCKIFNHHATEKGQVFNIDFEDKIYNVELNMLGLFQAQNILCAALMVAKASHIEFAKLVDDFKNLVPVVGRLQYVGTSVKNASIFIDYAHTSDAIEKALNVLRQHTKAKLHIVFGCGGDRDKGKRTLMGKVAADYADEVIITDDNPRTEDAAFIRLAIKQAATNAIEIADRQKAIEYAISKAEQGDIILVAGKGHEKGQIIGTTVYPFSDYECVKAILENERK